jgi:hypothetical protein
MNFCISVISIIVCILFFIHVVYGKDCEYTNKDECELDYCCVWNPLFKKCSLNPEENSCCEPGKKCWDIGKDEQKCLSTRCCRWHHGTCWNDNWLQIAKAIIRPQ